MGGILSVSQSQSHLLPHQRLSRGRLVKVFALSPEAQLLGPRRHVIQAGPTIVLFGEQIQKLHILVRADRRLTQSDIDKNG